MAEGAAARLREAGHSTWTDFVDLHEDDLRELIDGRLLEVEVPTYLHEHVVAALIVLLGVWANKHGGRVLASGYKLRISAKRGVMPDVQFYRARNPAAVGQSKGLEHGRPDLVVEVVSPTSRRYDRVLKVDWYARLGIPEYWIVDPEARTLERLVLRAGAYVHVEGHAEVDTFRPANFRGLSIPLRDLWAADGHLAGRRPTKSPKKRRKP